nr:hypothetical protein BdHM001_36180 [Bdellovibrio sp. HM001]
MSEPHSKEQTMKKFLVPVTVHVRQIVSVDAYVAIKAKSMAEAKKKG